jgi:hypothetical protein
MAALTGPRNAPRLGDTSIPERLSYPIAANIFCHQGGMAALNSSGQAVPAGSGTAATIAIGVFLDETDNTTSSTQGWSGLAGAVNCEIQRGAFAMDNSTSADLIANTNTSLPCYVVDDHTVALTDGNGARKFAGYILGVNVAGSNGGPNYPDGSADGRVYVQIGSDFGYDTDVDPAYPREVIALSIPLAAFPVGGGTVAAITPAAAGRILGVSYANTLVGAGTGATIAVSIKIAGTTMTGGGATLTLANQTQGSETQGAAVTALNTFTNAQQITIVGAAGTVFTSGQVQVNLLCG